MSAPCGEKLEAFVDELIAQKLVSPHRQAIIDILVGRGYREKIEFALEAYDEEKHWDWREYRRQMMRRIDWGLGHSEWRRGRDPDGACRLVGA